MQRGQGSFEPREGEVLRYLGHSDQTIDEELLARIETVRAQATDQLVCRWVWETWPVKAMPDGFVLVGSGVTLPGRSMEEHLTGAVQAALLCATAGPLPDLKTRTLQRRDPVAALAWDACGIDAVELAADAAEAEVAAAAAERGHVTGWRFSPGYGDLPLAVQPQVLAALDAERAVGVTLTDQLLMVPMKSVTAVVGLFPPGAAPADGSARDRCDDCSIRDACRLRAAGTPCWRKRDDHA